MTAPNLPSDLTANTPTTTANATADSPVVEAVQETLNTDTIAYTSPVAHATLGKPSWARWWRQVTFVPILHNRWFTAQGQQRLNQAVREAEIGHRGEVFLVVENHLPLEIARTHNSRDRAIQVFADYRVWDTADNTGVLVYLNVCEHRLEIVADRGINSHVMPTLWQALCDKAIEGLKAGKQVDSLVALLQDIGQLLRQHYQLENDIRGNELSDEMVFLR
ncbi:MULTISPECIES: TPM domain-containing protein [unclassified Moraxella]|uniref:TPM domain-containing protein n=1 Tax=unclassified Moraxella TaxID=2685852 RepID=UPI003AF5653A